MSYTHRIVWNGKASSSVIATGDFDKWSGSTVLDKQADGTWAADVKVDPSSVASATDEPAKPIRYKFVVDGTWQHADDQPNTTDDSGNVNNYFTVSSSAKQEKAGPADEADPVAIEAPASSGATEDLETIQSQQNGGQGRDLPTSLSELLGATEVSGGSGQPSIMRVPSGPDGQEMPFMTYNMSHFENIKHLNVMRERYPSRYLLQTESPEQATVPTDVQLACEYLGIRFRATRANGPSSSDQEKEDQETQQAAESEQPATDAAISEKKKAASRSPLKPEAPGILKIFARIKEGNPNWTFSEKRLRKVIKEQAVLEEAERILRLSNLIGGGKDNGDLVPVSRMDYALVRELGQHAASSSGSATTSTSTSNASTNGTGSKTDETIQPTGSIVDAEADKENSNGVANKKKGAKSGKKAKSQSTLASVADAIADKASTALQAAQEAVSGTSDAAPKQSDSPGKDTKTNSATQATGDVSLVWIDDVTGRGVVANRPFKRNDVIFREDAFAFAPTRNIQAAVNDGQACAYCGKLFFGKASSLVTPCVSHEGLSGSSSRRGVPPSSRKQPQSQVAKKDNSTNGSTENEKKKPACGLRFCNKLCRDRCNDTYGPLLCPIVNPSYTALLKWAENADQRNGKQNSLGVFKLLLCLLVTSQRDGFEKLHSAAQPFAAGSSGDVQHCGKELLDRIECLAAINERTRRQRDQGVLADMQFGAEWLASFRLIYEALQLPDEYYKAMAVSQKADEDESASIGEGDNNDSSPKNPGDTLQRPAAANALPEWLKKPLPQELADKIIGFDNFLVWLGRVALNQEDDGGIYLLHPCLNHSCDANAIVKRTASLNNVGAREAKPSRIFVVATKDIAKGEQITISYVSPDAPLEVRRGVLRANYLFECKCSRCEAQLAERNQHNHGSAAIAGSDGTDSTPVDNVDGTAEVQAESAAEAAA